MLTHRLLCAVALSCGILTATQAPAEPTKKQAATPKLPHLETMPVEKIVDLSLEEGGLVVRTALPGTPERSKVSIEGRPGFSTIQIMGDVEQGSPVRHFDFQHYEFSRPGTMSAMTQVQGTLINLQITHSIERLGGFQTIQLIQSNRVPTPMADEKENGIRLYVQAYDTLRDDETIDLNLWAPNLKELRRRYPKAVSRFVQPIMRDLGRPDLFAPEPALAWQVFSDQFQPDPKLKQQVEQLVARLDAQIFAEREKAFEELNQLGQSAAAVLVLMDRTALSGEQNARLDTLLADHPPVAGRQGQKLRQDDAFLLDCLYCADERIRALALEQLERNLGRQLGLDVSQPDAPSYRTGVELLRSELFRSLPPTMRPS